MVDEESAANPRAGVNVDAGQEAVDVGEKTRRKVQLGLGEAMGDAVQKDGMEARIAQHDLEDALGGGVLAKDCIHLFANGLEHDISMPPGRYNSNTDEPLIGDWIRAPGFDADRRVFVARLVQDVRFEIAGPRPGAGPDAGGEPQTPLGEVSGGGGIAAVR